MVFLANLNSHHCLHYSILLLPGIYQHCSHLMAFALAIIPCAWNALTPGLLVTYCSTGNQDFPISSRYCNMQPVLRITELECHLSAKLLKCKYGYKPPENLIPMQILTHTWQGAPYSAFLTPR